jgi:hypothetical protein
MQDRYVHHQQQRRLQKLGLFRLTLTATWSQINSKEYKVSMNRQQKGLKAKSKKRKAKSEKQNPFLDSWHGAGKACYPFRPQSLVELVHNRSAALQQLLLRFRFDQTNKVEGQHSLVRGLCWCINVVW